MIVSSLTTELVEEFNKYKESSKDKIMIAVHSGVFHTDEAMATVLLYLYHSPKQIAVVRTRNQAIIEKSDIVCDVGGSYDHSKKFYDHHHQTFTTTFPGHDIKLSSCGLIFMHYGKELIAKLFQMTNEVSIDYIYNKLYSSFIMAIDALDNGVPMYKTKELPQYCINTDLHGRVSRINPQWNDEGMNTDVQFAKALVICYDEFTIQLNFISKVLYPAKEIVEEAYKNRLKFHPSGKIMCLKTGCPWKDHLYSIEEKGSQLLFVIIPSSTNANYQLAAIPLSQGTFENRKPLCKAWRGKRDEELKKVTGFADAVFVHTTGFMGIFGTMESAVKAAEESISHE